MPRKPKPAASKARLSLITKAATPLPVADIPSDARIADRQTRLDAYLVEAARLKNLKSYARFADQDNLDLVCVLALADLFVYGDHSRECLDAAPNWLGAFLSDVLIEVAATGPESVNAHPEDVKCFFDQAIQNLRDAMEFCRRIGSTLPPSVLDEIEKCNTPADSTNTLTCC